MSPVVSASLFINSNQTMLHTDGIYDSSDFLNTISSEKYYSFDDFLENCSTLSKNLFYTIPNKVYLNNKYLDAFAVIRTFSNSGRKIDGAYIIFIDAGLFNELIPPSDQYKGVPVLLVDNQNHLLSGNPFIHEYVNKLDMPDNSGVLKNVLVNNATYTIFYKHFRNLPWRLVAYIPSASTEYLFGYTKWFFFVLSIFIFLGLLIASAISYSNYKPVSLIINTIKAKYKHTDNILLSNLDDYHFIESSLVNMNQTIEALSSENRLYKASVISLYIQKLLTSNHLNKNELIEIFDLLGLDMKNLFFLVCAIHSSSNASHFAPPVKRDNNYKEIIQHIDSRITMTDNLGYYRAGKIEDKQILLFYSKSSNTSSESNRTSYNKIISILSGISNPDNISIQIGIGSLTEQPDELHKSYMDACAALSYALLFDINSITEYIHISTIAFEPFYYPLELEATIMRALKSYDYHKINQVLDSIKEINLNQKFLDMVSAKCLFFKLYATLIKGIDLLNTEASGRYVHDALNISSIHSMIDHINNTFKILCLETADKNSLENTSIRIQEFLNSNFQNPDLSIDYVAKLFNVSTLYVSKTFRNDTEAGFLDYINSKRIQYSLALLTKTDQHISQISKMSGFSNLYTFIRVFKRYKGMTPSYFREIHADR